MYITEIIPFRRSKSRSRIHLEDGAGFVLYNKEIRRFELEPESEILPETWQEILEEILIPRAKKRAMHLLEEQDRTTGELRKKLLDSGYPEEAVTAALEYVASFHYTDDERYARNYIRFHQESKSRRRLAQDLKQKGVPEDLIGRAMEEENETDPVTQMTRLLTRKHYDLLNPDDTIQKKETARAYRFLASRGYEISDIREAVRGYAEQLEQDAEKR